MKQCPTDYTSGEVAHLFHMTHLHLMTGVAAGRYPLPDYIEAHKQYWRASSVAAWIGAIGAPLGVDASALVEGMQRLEDGQGGGHG